MTKEDIKVKKILAEALKDAFGEHQASKRFIDVSRIPLLCKSVINTNMRLGKIEEKLDDKFVSIERYQPIEKIVIGMVGVILLAVIGAIVMNVIK